MQPATFGCSFQFFATHGSHTTMGKSAVAGRQQFISLARKNGYVEIQSLLFE
jgi:hypothetical protein